MQEPSQTQKTHHSSPIVHLGERRRPLQTDCLTSQKGNKGKIVARAGGEVTVACMRMQGLLENDKQSEMPSLKEWSGYGSLDFQTTGYAFHSGGSHPVRKH